MIAASRCVGSHEGGPRDEELVGDGREVQREVMPFKAPSPRCRGARSPEDRDEVLLWVTALGAVLQDSEDALELDDRVRFLVPLAAQRLLQQCVSSRALRLRHLLEGKAIPGPRDEVPIQPLVIRERISGLIALRIA